MRPITCTEGEWFDVAPELQEAVRTACRRTAAQINPSFRILAEANGRFAISGVIGTIGIGPKATLEISPKTTPEEDWIQAVLHLLTGIDRIDAAGERAASLSPNRRTLLEVLAAVYAARLQKAIRRDGPILLIERTQSELPYLKGKLRVTPWLRHAAWEPHRLPVSFNHLAADHGFSRGLATVARLLAGSTRSAHTRGALLDATRALRPGFGEDITAPSTVARQQLPIQWASYQPAWSIAVAILAQRSVLGPTGRHLGVSVAIEAWPLLERLLERSLAAAVQISSARGRTLYVPSKQESPLLVQPAGSASGSRAVIPDGRLMEGTGTLATFEAKYKCRSTRDAWPPREDVYQALCAAAACGSELAVLVYPEVFEPAYWTVKGFAGRPQRLAAIGLDLFSYRAGSGDQERGERIVTLLDNELGGHGCRAYPRGTTP